MGLECIAVPAIHNKQQSNIWGIADELLRHSWEQLVHNGLTAPKRKLCDSLQHAYILQRTCGSQTLLRADVCRQFLRLQLVTICSWWYSNSTCTVHSAETRGAYSDATIVILDPIWYGDNKLQFCSYQSSKPPHRWQICS